MNKRQRKKQYKKRFYQNIKINVMNMAKMFSGKCKFNQDISAWNTAGIKYIVKRM
jgi:hypothetical protein